MVDGKILKALLPRHPQRRHTGKPHYPLARRCFERVSRLFSRAMQRLGRAWRPRMDQSARSKGLPHYPDRCLAWNLKDLSTYVPRRPRVPDWYSLHV